ncbi:MAG: O-antigen ligase family protein [Terriglobales bacterium]
MALFYLLVSGMPLVNQPLFSQFVEQLTMMKYLGIACLFYALLHVALKRSLPSGWRGGLAILFVIFYAWVAFSYWTKGNHQNWQMSPFLSLTSFLLLYWIVVAVVDTEDRLRWTIYAAIASVGVGAVYMVREWQEYHLLYANFRPGYVVGDANYFTLSALLCLPLSYFMLQERRPWWERGFLAGSILITLVAVALAASRGGLLGLVVVCLFIVVRSRHRVRNLLVVGALLVAVVALTPVSSLDRLLHPDYSDVAAEQERLVVWRAGLRMIETHPWVGIGLGNFKPSVAAYEDGRRKVVSLAHNTYIGMAAELGLPGLAMFVGLLGMALHLAAQACRRAGPEVSTLRQATLGVQAGLLGCVVGIFFLSADQQKLLWLMLFLTPCLVHLAEVGARARQDALALARAATPEWGGAVVPVGAQSGSLGEWARDLAGIFR